MKSLSKGNKKETINLKESTTQPEEDDYDVDTTEEFYEPKLESRNWNPDDDLNALLKVWKKERIVIGYSLVSWIKLVLLQEEEELVDAHRKQVEDTMNIVRVVCNVFESFWAFDKMIWSNWNWNLYCYMFVGDEFTCGSR